LRWDRRRRRLGALCPASAEQNLDRQRIEGGAGRVNRGEGRRSCRGQGRPNGVDAAEVECREMDLGPAAIGPSM
jgi:hypothetical protein